MQTRSPQLSYLLRTLPTNSPHHTVKRRAFIAAAPLRLPSSNVARLVLLSPSPLPIFGLRPFLPTQLLPPMAHGLEPWINVPAPPCQPQLLPWVLPTLLPTIYFSHLLKFPRIPPLLAPLHPGNNEKGTATTWYSN